MADRDVLITGIGLVSSLGEGKDAHLRAFSGEGRPVVDSEHFAPVSVHPLPEIDWSLQIARRDQRQMETWQRLGTYAAGLALDDAGLKTDEDRCARMHMIVAAGGGERDAEVDASILAAGLSRNDRDVLINEKLMTELRPTLFLAQLANLLAGNISIVHKVTGSSRTVMGEEGAGIAAIESAVSTIAAGQAECTLVGGAYNAAHWDMLLTYALGGHLHTAPWKPVWQRQGESGGGIVTGCGAAFLILESRASANERGAKSYARLDRVVSRRTSDGDAFKDMIDRIAPETAAEAPLLTISGASGAHGVTAAEREALSDTRRFAIRGMSTMTGHLKEAQFPFAVALAALAISGGQGFPPFDPTEPDYEGAPRMALATCAGYSRQQGAALVVSA